MQFFGYLRRDPNSGPDTDYTGYEFWLAKLNQFNGNFVNAEMVKAFITSTEYRIGSGRETELCVILSLAHENLIIYSTKWYYRAALRPRSPLDCKGLVK